LRLFDEAHARNASTSPFDGAQDAEHLDVGGGWGRWDPASVLDFRSI
jgi:hypothetical protein